MRSLVLDIPEINRAFESFFHSWPTEPKPPIEGFPIVDPNSSDTESVRGWEIQMAVAGFGEENVEVWSEGKVLHIKGSNKENDVAPRFSCSFYHKIPCSKYLDIDRAEAKLVNGILSIKIPVEEERVEQRRYLLKKEEIK